MEKKTKDILDEIEKKTEEDIDMYVHQSEAVETRAVDNEVPVIDTSKTVQQVLEELAAGLQQDILPMLPKKYKGYQKKKLQIQDDFARQVSELVWNEEGGKIIKNFKDALTVFKMMDDSYYKLLEKALEAMPKQERSGFELGE